MSMAPKRVPPSRARAEGKESACLTGPARSVRSVGGGRPLLRLQRLLGNSRVARLVHTRRLTPSGRITRPGVTPVLARKAEINLPGWGSPLVGDDDSDVTFTPSGDFRTMGFQRDMAALGKAEVVVSVWEQISEGEAAAGGGTP